jgi:hypothetical protein
VRSPATHLEAKHLLTSAEPPPPSPWRHPLSQHGAVGHLHHHHSTPTYPSICAPTVIHHQPPLELTHPPNTITATVTNRYGVAGGYEDENIYGLASSREIEKDTSVGATYDVANRAGAGGDAVYGLNDEPLYGLANRTTSDDDDDDDGPTYGLARPSNLNSDGEVIYDNGAARQSAAGAAGGDIYDNSSNVRRAGEKSHVEFRPASTHKSAASNADAGRHSYDLAAKPNPKEGLYSVPNTLARSNAATKQAPAYDIAVNPLAVMNIPRTESYIDAAVISPAMYTMGDGGDAAEYSTANPAVYDTAANGTAKPATQAAPTTREVVPVKDEYVPIGDEDDNDDNESQQEDDNVEWRDQARDGVDDDKPKEAGYVPVGTENDDDEEEDEGDVPVRGGPERDVDEEDDPAGGYLAMEEDEDEEEAPRTTKLVDLVPANAAGGKAAPRAAGAPPKKKIFNLSMMRK